MRVVSKKIWVCISLFPLIAETHQIVLRASKKASSGHFFRDPVDEEGTIAVLSTELCEVGRQTSKFTPPVAHLASLVGHTINVRGPTIDCSINVNPHAQRGGIISPNPHTLDRLRWALQRVSYAHWQGQRVHPLRRVATPPLRRSREFHEDCRCVSGNTRLHTFHLLYRPIVQYNW